MRKGELTHQTILETAVRLASRVGLHGLSIGGLAEELSLSKSGLFAHFKSKTELQVQVLEAATAAFTERVIRPALGQPRGEPRVRALFDGWLTWDRDKYLEGGCIFVAAAAELDDVPGPRGTSWCRRSGTGWTAWPRPRASPWRRGTSARTWTWSSSPMTSTRRCSASTTRSG